MRKDPFFREIIERLGLELDPNLFEACANDLLIDAYPSLAPVPGGQDAGMDGAIGDGEGEPFPLVATTGKDVLGNLTRSLNSYIEEGRRRKVILATSQHLSPKRTRNLYDRARELGFTLIDVHSRDDIANRLYRRPDWCRELLNLSGRPSAFSEFPKSERPVLNNTLIGREADMIWLFSTSGDRLLIGQPGCGKTFLLLKYVTEGKGYYVVDHDREQIANGIREYQPTTLIVDDAGAQLSLIAELKHLRNELGVQFDILASCWHIDEPILRQTLNLGTSSVRFMELLTRDQIVKVINDVGLIGPNELVKEIVDQAEGRAGLAALLAYLCLLGDVREVFGGEALTESILRYMTRSGGNRARYVLAAFSIGGEAGMKPQDVADSLGMNVIDVKEIVTELSAGGVIWETGEMYLSVHPKALRQVLIRDAFFSRTCFFTHRATHK